MFSPTLYPFSTRRLSLPSAHPHPDHLTSPRLDSVPSATRKAGESAIYRHRSVGHDQPLLESPPDYPSVKTLYGEFSRLGYRELTGSKMLSHEVSKWASEPGRTAWEHVSKTAPSCGNPMEKSKIESPTLDLVYWR